MKYLVLLTLIFSFQAHAKDFGDDEKQLKESVEKLFAAQARVLDNSRNSVKRTAHWDFTNLIVELGISHSGKFGLLAFNGTAAASAYWSKKGAGPARPYEPTVDLVLDSSMTYPQIEVKVEDIIRAILKADLVDNPHIFRQHMYELFKEFYVVSQALAHQDTKGFRASRLFFERSVNQRGDIFAAFIKRSTLRFRIMWDLQNGAVHKLPPDLEKKKVKIQSSLQKMIKEFASDLHYTANLLPPDERLHLKSFNIGLGISKSSKYFLGLLKDRQTATGIIEFDYIDSNKSASVPEPLGTGTFNILELKPGTQDYIKTQGLSRKDLRKGLTFAFNMASKMFGYTMQNGSLGWDMNRLDISFQMGVQGRKILPTVGGYGTSTITFAKH